MLETIVIIAAVLIAWWLLRKVASLVFRLVGWVVLIGIIWAVTQYTDALAP